MAERTDQRGRGDLVDHVSLGRLGHQGRAPRRSSVPLPAAQLTNMFERNSLVPAPQLVFGPIARYRRKNACDQEKGGHTLQSDRSEWRYHVFVSQSAFVFVGGRISAAIPQSFTCFHRTGITSTMSKPSLIDTLLHFGSSNTVFWAVWVFWSVCLPSFSGAQEADASAGGKDAQPVYPLSVAVRGGEVFAVDLDLPGVWKSLDGHREVFIRGSNLLRKPLNRPRAIALHPSGGIIVGDSATREIYVIEAVGSDPKPLTDGHLGNAMALAVDPDGKMLYVGDAEKRALFRLPIEGGPPELVARVNARGLAFDADGKLWAVTPDDEAVQRIDVTTKEVESIVTGRPFQYPNGLAWAGDHGYVTDGYGKCIWKFTADGKTEKWFEGDPLVGPVGITVTDSAVFVADPKQKQVYEINRATKDVKERL